MRASEQDGKDRLTIRIEVELSNSMTLFRLNKIDEDGNRISLFESRSIEAMLEWSEKTDSEQLKDMFRFMKEHEDKDGEFGFGITQISPHLELDVISDDDA